MSIEVDVLIDTYQTLYQYIPSKDRQEAADHLMSILVDCVSDEELAEIGLVDSYMKRAYKEYTMDDPDDYDEDE
jgi:hypothetical protein